MKFETKSGAIKDFSWLCSKLNTVYVEVVTCVAGSLEDEGLPGYPQKLACWIKGDEALTVLFITLLHELLDKT